MANQHQKRWRVTNITARPARVNPSTKQDERTAIERNGYSISFREEGSPNNTVLGPSQLKIVSGLSNGLIGLANDGLVKIEEFGDISELLQAHASSGKRVTRRGARKDVEESPALFADQLHPQGRRAAKAAEMGADVANKEEKSEHVDAVNPTGMPNFVVSAPSEETRKRMKRA